jgi:hypothetical protein
MHARTYQPDGKNDEGKDTKRLIGVEDYIVVERERKNGLGSFCGKTPGILGFAPSRETARSPKKHNGLTLALAHPMHVLASSKSSDAEGCL